MILNKIIIHNSRLSRSLNQTTFDIARKKNWILSNRFPHFKGLLSQFRHVAPCAPKIGFSTKCRRRFKRMFTRQSRFEREEMISERRSEDRVNDRERRQVLLPSTASFMPNCSIRVEFRPHPEQRLPVRTFCRRNRPIDTCFFQLATINNARVKIFTASREEAKFHSEF